jgi:predicted transport protein
MKIIELGSKPPSMKSLLKAVEEDDVLLVRAGHPLIRIEKFDDNDWDDWKYEHSAAAIARGDVARKQYRNGEYRTLSSNGETDRLRIANESIRLLFQRYKAAILQFEEFGGSVTLRPTDRGYSFSVNGHRLATFTIQKCNLKIWLKVNPGAVRDPKGRSRETKIANTIQSIRDDHDFDYIVGLLKQAYLENR